MFDPSWDERLPELHRRADELSEGLLAISMFATRPSRSCRGRRSRSWSGTRRQQGWTFPWYSSFGSDFNYDFHVTLDASSRRWCSTSATIDEHEAGTARAGLLRGAATEQPGYSTFMVENGEVFHTNSVFGRGTEMARRLVCTFST